MIKSFIMQLQFLTRIPLPFSVTFDEHKFARAIIFAPLIGGIIGVLLGSVYYVMSMLAMPVLTIVVVMVCEVMVTGGLHLDGLVDTCDGIFSNRPKERVLEIMRDPRVGTFGILALVFVLALKAVILYYIDSAYILPCLVAMPVLSRINIAWSAALATYARKEGYGKTITDNTNIPRALVATIVGLGIAIPVFGLDKIHAICIMVIAMILFTLLFVRYVKKKIGGITGDVIGAVIELSEIVYLMTCLGLVHSGLFVVSFIQ